MTDILVGKRIEDPLSDVESLINNGYLQIRPSRPYAAGGQWVDDAWSAPIPMTGAVLTFKLDPIADVPYELFWHYTDGRNQVKEGSEFRTVTSSGTPLKWEDLTQSAGPGSAPPLPSSAEARLLALETLYSTLSGGASTLSAITDMTPAARTLNAKTTTAAMLTYLGAGPSSLVLGTTTGTAADGGVVNALGTTVSGHTTSIATLTTSVAGKISGTEITNTPIFWATVSGVYPARPATTRPVVFTDPNVQPANTGSTSGGGGMVPGLDFWIS